MRNFGFSSDIDKVHLDLSNSYASGGGDRCEAVTAALGESLNMGWREQVSKVIVLIADAPHGVGEYGTAPSQVQQFVFTHSSSICVVFIVKSESA